MALIAVDRHFGADRAAKGAVLLDDQRLAVQRALIVLGDRPFGWWRVLQRPTDQLGIGMRVANQLAVTDHHEAEPRGLLDRFRQRLDGGRRVWLAERLAYSRHQRDGLGDTQRALAGLLLDQP